MEALQMRDVIGFAVGDRVVHVKDPSWIGVVLSVDENWQDAPTCFEIQWEDDGSKDIQWTNKFEVLDEVIDVVFNSKRQMLIGE